METSLRIVLLLVGILLVIGIIWDSIRSSKRRRKPGLLRKSKESEFNDIVLDHHTGDSDFDENNENLPEVISLYVMARKPGTFYGKRLLEALQDVQMVFGKDKMFHREDIKLISAIEPGFFDVKKMESIATPGVALFFELTTPNQSIASFELMLRTAKQLAMRLDGELKDSDRNPLSNQTIERIREQIRSNFLLRAEI